MADYCTAEEIKAALPDGNWGTDYNALFTSVATRASRVIDRFTKREPGAFAVAADTTRYFDGGHPELLIGELAAAPTSVQIAESGDLTDLTDLATTDYYLTPYNALLEGIPYNFVCLDLINGDYFSWPSYSKSIKIIGKFGYATTIPEDVKQAAIIQAARWFKRGQQGFQDTGAIPEFGQLTYTQAMDPDVKIIIDYLRRVTI